MSVDVTEDGPDFLTIEADGGSRRERAGRIAAVLRARRPKVEVEQIFVSYSETYGFQTRTTIRYRKVK